MKFRSLRTHILFWAGLCLLLLGAVVITFATISVRNTAVQRAKEQLRFMAREHAEHVVQALNVVMNTSRILADPLSGRLDPLEPLNLDRDDVDNILRSILQRNRDIGGIFTCWEPNAFDNEDALYAYEPGHDETGRFAPYWYRNMDGFIVVEPLSRFREDFLPQLCKETGEAVLFGPYMQVIDGTDIPIISFMAPVLYEQGVYGVVGLDLDIVFIKRLIEKTEIEEKNGEIVIFTSSLKIVGKTGNQIQGGIDLFDVNSFDSENKVQFGRGEPFWSHRHGRIEFFTPIRIPHSEPWWMMISLPEKEIFAEAKILTWHLVIVGGLSVFIAMIFLWVLASRIVRPLRLFTKATREIGKGDYGRFVVGIETKDEIGELVRAFNVMSKQIAARETELKCTYEDLLKSKEEWEKSFDSITDIVTVQDKDMRILRTNKAACHFFEKTEEELIGQYCYEIFCGASEPCPGCPAVETLHDLCEHSALITHENLGKIFYMSSSPVFDKDNTIEYVVQFAKDVTEQKRLEQELFQAHKMEAIGTLAGGIAHDFNNILAAIIGYAELAKDDIPESSRAKGDIEEVLIAGNRAKELVKQILAFSRRGPQERKPLKPYLVIKEALKLMRASIPVTIDIQEEIDKESGTILADPTQVHQVLVNLCTNAFHAVKQERGVIKVKLSRKDLGPAELGGEPDVAPSPFVELMVSDTGHGMDEATMDRIFEPYFTTKKLGKGTGMGLAVVHGIILDHGGIIKVESEVGKGTIIRVYFPAIEENVAETEEKTDYLPTGDERILVIDDEKTIIGILKTILERLGYKVTGTTDITEALDTFRSDPDGFDLIITDQTMPQMTGTELAEEALKIRPDIPIILCTGYSSLISEEKAGEIGIKRFLFKPLDKKEIAGIVRKVLDEK